MKFLTISLILMILVTMSAMAANRFSFGAVSYQCPLFDDDPMIDRLLDLDPDNNREAQGLRMQSFVHDWLGVSAEVMLLGMVEDGGGLKRYRTMYMTQAVLRLPNRLLEPYVGAGPVWQGGDVEGILETLGDIDFAIRCGLDINFLNWLSAGIEANFLFHDIRSIFKDFRYYAAGLNSDQMMIGFVANIKL